MIGLDSFERDPELAVTVRDPAPFSTIWKERVPFKRVALEGRSALGSEEVKVIESEKSVTTLFFESRAVTVTVKASPAVVAAGTEVSTKELALPESTVT